MRREGDRDELSDEFSHHARTEVASDQSKTTTQYTYPTSVSILCFISIVVICVSFTHQSRPGVKMRSSQRPVGTAGCGRLCGAPPPPDLEKSATPTLRSTPPMRSSSTRGTRPGWTTTRIFSFYAAEDVSGCEKALEVAGGRWRVPEDRWRWGGGV